MSIGQTLGLGALAGATILLGLPVGRMRRLRPGTRVMLNALAVGILLFLAWDVLSNAYAPLAAALDSAHAGHGGAGAVAAYGALFLGGLAGGVLSLVLYEQWLGGRGRKVSYGPGAMADGELALRRAGLSSWSPARRMALLIAVGIGLHNFGEGLAIGGSAAIGAISLTTLLVIGFALHNATEGFGIVGPLAAADEPTSWAFLIAMGAIAGTPTLIGTVVGRELVSPALTTLFLSLAAGSIIYVVIQLLGVAQRAGRKNLVVVGVLLGLLAGFVTDMVVTAAGG